MYEKIGIVGFGYIGSVLGVALANKNISVVGIDKDTKLISSLSKGISHISEPNFDFFLQKALENKKLVLTDDFGALGDCKVIIICVGTYLNENGEADLKPLVSAATHINRYVNNDTLIILKSTVPPQTTESILHPILSKNAKPKIAFCPERLAEGTAFQDLINLPIIIGGVDRQSTEAAEIFWKETLGLTTKIVNSTLSAELVKLADNLWIDLNIALANELALLSDKLGADVVDIIEGANTLKKGSGYVNILSPSLGVGGSCLTKDPWFLYNLAKKYDLQIHTPKISRTINDRMPLYAFNILHEHLRRKKKPRNTKIAILGISFKDNTGDCRFTPTQTILDNLEKAGYNLSIHDPLVSKESAAKITNLPLNSSLEETLHGADCVSFFTGHDIFKKLVPETLKGLISEEALIFDGRNIFNKKTIMQFKEDGFSYIGIGRR